VIELPPSEECQFDWQELPDTPALGLAAKAILLVGGVVHSER